MISTLWNPKMFTISTFFSDSTTISSLTLLSNVHFTVQWISTSPRWTRSKPFQMISRSFPSTQRTIGKIPLLFSPCWLLLLQSSIRFLLSIEIILILKNPQKLMVYRFQMLFVLCLCVFLSLFFLSVGNWNLWYPALLLNKVIRYVEA